jgi:hypothetical protein
MKVFVQTQNTAVQADLTQLVRDTMTPTTYKSWTPIEEFLDNAPGGVVTLVPGEAVYFLGGRKSLYRMLNIFDHRSIRCPGGGVYVAGRSRINLGAKTRIGGFFKGLVSKPRHNFFEMTEKEFRELSTKALTCLCVYNSDTGTRPAPVGTFVVNLIDSEVTVQSIAVHLKNTLGLNINEGTPQDITYGRGEVRWEVTEDY